MSSLLYALIGIRGLALMALLSGQKKLSDTLYATAELVEAGKATDEQLALVAEKLKSRELALSDWEDVYARIRGDRDRLHAPLPPAGEAGRARIGVLVLLAALAGVALAAEPVRQATLTWTAPTQYVSGAEISVEDRALLRYNVYRGQAGTAPAGKVRIAQELNGLQYVDAGRPIGATDCYQVTALFAGQPDTEGEPSSEGCKSFPRPAAGAPTLTVE